MLIPAGVSRRDGVATTVCGPAGTLIVLPQFGHVTEYMGARYQYGSELRSGVPLVGRIGTGRAVGASYFA